MVAPTDVRSDWSGVWKETLVWLNTRDTSFLGSSIDNFRGWWNGMPYIYPLSALFLRRPTSVRCTECRRVEMDMYIRGLETTIALGGERLNARATGEIPSPAPHVWLGITVHFSP